MRGSVPVVFHIGCDVTLKTKGRKGRAVVNDTSLSICENGSETEISFPAESMESVALVRPHKVGAVIKVDLGSEFLFVAVTRFVVGQLALVNYVRTVHLFNALSTMCTGPSTSEFPVHVPLSQKRRLAIFFISAAVSFSCVALLSFFKRYWQ
ncbi:MAG: hypothetical protein ACT6U0_08905 [Shinella sp.]|uniref:hypothetical protein n=1 Tax=Shinella sp. TaxID=1870904 RepID=UPI004035AA65